MDIDAIQQATARFFELAADTREDREDDPAWTDALAEAFLHAGFGFDPNKPVDYGPDSFQYFFTRRPTLGQPFTTPEREMDQLVHWAVGWAVLTPDNEPIRVYSGGDLVSLKLYGRSRVRWVGGWSEDPVLKEYRRTIVEEAGLELIADLPAN